MRHHSRTYYRYLFSYLALLLVGVIALLIFFEMFFVTRQRSNILETQQGILTQDALNMDNSLRQIQAVDYQLTSANENFLSYYLMEDSPARDMRIVQELERMTAPNPILKDIAMYCPATGYVYSSTGAYASSIFFSSIYRYEAWHEPERELQTILRRTVRPVETVNGSERYLTLIHPPSVFSRMNDTTLLFLIRENRLTQMFNTQSGMERESLIVDEAGQILFATLPLTDADFLTKQGEFLLSGTRYHSLSQPSQVLDWMYVALLPVKQLFSPIARARLVMAVTLGIMLGLGVTLIMFFMRVNYAPLKELGVALGVAGDEVESLRDAIGQMATQNESLRTQLMNSPDGQTMKDALLFSLLKGKFSSFEAFNREAEPLGVAFHMPVYQVLMLKLFAGKEEVPFPRAELTAALSQVFAGDTVCLFRELFEPTMAVCLLGMQPHAQEQTLHQCEALIRLLHERSGLVFSIGASRCYSGIEQITTACFEANQAVREHFVRGTQQVIGYDTLVQTPPSINPPAMLNALKTQTPAQQADTIRAFVAQLAQSNTPSLLAKSWCNYAVQLLLELSPGHWSVADLFSISYLSTLEQYEALMLEMLTPEAPQEQTEEPTEEMELLERIRRLIQAQYDDCNFSMQDVAERLGLNSSYMSQYFHQQTGDTLSAYVSDLRMQKARTLLETTTMPLQMVAESVGYYNLNSFIRRFKQIAGVTPGEYRRTHQQ